MAAVIAATFPTTIDALTPGRSPSSASAMARAEAVRFSICELAADSERSSTAAKGAISPPSSASKRATSLAASEEWATTSGAQGDRQVGDQTEGSPHDTAHGVAVTACARPRRPRSGLAQGTSS